MNGAEDLSWSFNQVDCFRRAGMIFPDLAKKTVDEGELRELSVVSIARDVVEDVAELATQPVDCAFGALVDGERCEIREIVRRVVNRAGKAVGGEEVVEPALESHA